jgi:hypothetical protein
MGLKHWNNIRSQDFISIALSGKRSVTEVKWRLVTEWCSCPWQEVLFSDESRFCISNAEGRIRVWRRENERLAACCIDEVDRWGGANAMIWAAVSFRYKSPLHFCDRSLPNASQTCSIGVISDDSDGQCIQLTFCACKKFIETLAAICPRELFKTLFFQCVAVVLPVSP